MKSLSKGKKKYLYFKYFSYLCDKIFVMGTISEYIDFSKDIPTIISQLKEKSVSVPDWNSLRKDYYPKEHYILKDTINLRDKRRKDGSVEKSCRLTLGMEKLLVKRMSEFMFTIPVNRIYGNTENNDIRQNIAKAIESIYKYASINTYNLQRSKDYFACCEIFTLWYAVKSHNTLYGFPCDYKLKCKTFSPMHGTNLYPLFDEKEDMIAMSYEYIVKKGSKSVTYFETYTDKFRYKWKNESGQWESTGDPDEILLMKIPGIYLSRDEAIYCDVSEIRKEIEYTLSRNSNVISYNSAPVLKVVGEIIGEEKKNEDLRLFRMKDGGDVSYVSWDQSVQAITTHIDQLKELFWSLSQLPDISFSNMQKLGNIGYDARETLLTDAHLKVGDESGDWIKFFERETNVIKAFLKMMKTEWVSEIDNVEVIHTIIPFIQKNEAAEISKRIEANGGKAIESRLESIQRFGKSQDPNATLRQIQEEEAVECQPIISDIFGSAK